jgi:hypothetical protein
MWYTATAETTGVMMLDKKVASASGAVLPSSLRESMTITASVGC